MFETVQFSSIGEFIGMGGYAFNVWSVYLLFILFFFINLYFPLLRKKRILREQKRRLIVNAAMESNNPDGEEAQDLSGPVGESQ